MKNKNVEEKENVVNKYTFHELEKQIELLQAEHGK